MEIKTYKEIYNEPVKQIAVPAEFQMGQFEVLFMKKMPEPQNKPKAKRQPNPLLRGLGVRHDELIAPTTKSEDWELD